MESGAAWFAERLVAWQRIHGRHGFPWQQSRDAYRVWLSEIMLQQTQVAAVLPYYRRFVERYPTVGALAAASDDDVMAAWSGLGYYSRARNLHAAARLVVERHDGVFPDDADRLEELPGVGRSTAAAIAVFSHGRRAAILDGNVKRVLARVFAIDGVPSVGPPASALWRLAESLLPDVGIEPYTQGLMDLGATICTPRNPKCLLCPFEHDCLARRAGRIADFPQKVTRKALPERRTTLLMVTRGRDLLMERRPPIGVWGGLWSLPEVDAGDVRSAFDRAAVQFDSVASAEIRPGFRHGFTHFVLQADVLRIWLDDGAAPGSVAASDAVRWVSAADRARLGMPAPVRTLLDAGFPDHPSGSSQVQCG